MMAVESIATAKRAWQPHPWPQWPFWAIFGVVISWLWTFPFVPLWVAVGSFLTAGVPVVLLISYAVRQQRLEREGHELSDNEARAAESFDVDKEIVGIFSDKEEVESLPQVEDILHGMADDSSAAGDGSARRYAGW